MVSLVIKNEDGSVYWQEFFNTKDECAAWLSIEKTRPYWKDKFLVETIDNTEKFKEERLKIVADQEEERAKIKDLASKKNRSADELDELLGLLANRVL